MCGIVGYLGPKNPQDVIVSGLKKLEYRGYDSAGVAILNEGKTKRVRAQGKLKALEEKLLNEKYVYGLSGLAKILGCSKNHAGKLKSKGIFDEAIIQNGRKIIIDSEKALELFKNNNK